jgi:hypothetical protein
MRRALASVGLTLVVGVILAAPAGAAGPDPVGPPSQSLADGCQRNVPGFLTYTSPEWVYVHSYSQFQAPDQTRVAEGVVHNSHPSEDDLPQGHKSFDLNANVTVDPQYQDLVAGDPAAHTGNYAPGEEQGALHVEWEQSAVPSWVWPTENDRAKLWGSWIWDCGHWGVGFPDYFLPSQLPFTGSITGERTELHSIKAMVVTRANPYRSPANEAQTDVFASTDGRIAHAQEQCAHDHPAPGPSSYGIDYTACVQDPAMQKQTLNDRDYSFFVPAPPKPTSSAVLTYRVVDMLGGNQPPEVVTRQANGINVTVKFSGSSAPAYGKSFYVGWTTATRPPDHLRLVVNSITVNRSLDPNPDRPAEQTGQPPGEYNLYMDANGDWKFLNDWAPGLMAVADGQTFQPNQGIDFYVQRDKAVRVAFTGRECDFVGIEPCPQTAELADQNDRPGTATSTFPSVKDALGRHTVDSNLATPSVTDPTRKPSYQITYTVAKVGG